MVNIVLLLPLSFMIYSDFKERVVGIFPLILFCLMQAWNGWWEMGTVELLIRIVLNLGVLLFMGMGVILYLGIKQRRFTNPLRSHIGLGDVWFLVGLTPAFGLYTFVWFLIISFVSTLLVFVLLHGIKKKITIPLVSTVGICYIIYLVGNCVQLICDKI